jgi:hypothetical protein
MRNKRGRQDGWRWVLVRARGPQRDVVHLGWQWPKAPSYMSPTARDGACGLRGLGQWVQLCTWSPNEIWRSNSTVCLTHKVRTYKEYHSVCPSSELGLSPTPHPQASVPPPPVSGGRGTLAGEKGVGRVPIPTKGVHCGTLYMYLLCGLTYGQDTGERG